MKGYSNKGLFLDRDGVINRERGDYTYHPRDFEILPGVAEAIAAASGAGFIPVVITNQAGISLCRYTLSEMRICHEIMMKAIPEIKAVYFSPYHPDITRSLSRKPATLLFERALHRFEIDPASSYMAGDKDRDLLPARQLGISTIMIGSGTSPNSDHQASSLGEAWQLIAKNF